MAPTAASSTSRSAMSATTSSAEPPLFSKKPPIVCQLTSPEHYSRTRQERTYVEHQEIPNSSLCDYVMLDLPQSPDGTYDIAAYGFLRRSTVGNKFLFTVNTDVNTLITLGTAKFYNMVHTIQQILSPNTLYGFGILRGIPVPSTTAQVGATETLFRGVYELLARALNSTGVEESNIANFFAFKPDYFSRRRQIYAEFLSMLNRVHHLRLVIMLTLSDENKLEVAPSSSWNRTCQPVRDEPRMIDAVDLISSVSAPKVIFTLTLSLRIDTFADVQMSNIGTKNVGIFLSQGHSTGYYDRECEDFFQYDSRGTSAVYFGGGDCMFAPKHGSHSVMSFETPKTVRHKMVTAYRHLGYGKTSQYVIGWTVYNVTHGTAPQLCNGTNNRINQIRQVIEDNK